MTMKNWVGIPTEWIEQGGLKDYRWAKFEGSSAIAALMILAAIAHHCDDECKARVTYDVLALATGLSRTKIAEGLKVLKSRNVIELSAENQSVYRLTNYNPKRGWGKLPAKLMYREGVVTAFKDFHLRKVAELDALKAYFVIVARRDNNTNLANVTYDKLEDLAGINRSRIKTAISLLLVNNLVQVEQAASSVSQYGVSNAYRLVHLDGGRHMGTIGRRLMSEGGFKDT